MTRDVTRYRAPLRASCPLRVYRPSASGLYRGVRLQLWDWVDRMRGVPLFMQSATSHLASLRTQNRNYVFSRTTPFLHALLHEAASAVGHSSVSPPGHVDSSAPGSSQRARNVAHLRVVESDRQLARGTFGHRGALANLGRGATVESNLARRAAAVLQHTRATLVCSERCEGNIGDVRRFAKEHYTLQSNLTRKPAFCTTLPNGSPCIALTILLPFCGKVHSTVPFG